MNKILLLNTTYRSWQIMEQINTTQTY